MCSRRSAFALTTRPCLALLCKLCSSALPRDAMAYNPAMYSSAWQMPQWGAMGPPMTPTSLPTTAMGAAVTGAAPTPGAAPMTPLPMTPLPGMMPAPVTPMTTPAATDSDSEASSFLRNEIPWGLVSSNCSFPQKLHNKGSAPKARVAWGRAHSFSSLRQATKLHFMSHRECHLIEGDARPRSRRTPGGRFHPSASPLAAVGDR